MYTYEDFVKAAGNMINQFSPADLATAKANPEFGMSLLTLKQDYAKAGTDQAKALIHTEAEKLRGNYGNYTSRDDGTGYYSLLQSPNDFQGDSRISGLLDRMGSYPSFSYDKNQDPNYSAYKKEYLREGERATQNALAQGAMLTGGIPSSYAQTAATQAGDYYASKLSDKLPELYESAYGRYLGEFNMLGSQLSALQGQDEINYGRFLDENEFQQRQQAQAALAAQAEAQEVIPTANIGTPESPGTPGSPQYDVEEKPSGEKVIAQAAAAYYKAHPNVKIDSRTLDNWLKANGYSGAAAQTFKSYLEYYGAGYERGY
jgi:hypothetical protein